MFQIISKIRPKINIDSIYLSYFSAKFDISIPEELKYVLVSDWDLLTHKKSLFSLPAKITVTNILTDYIKNADKLASGMFLF